MTINGGQPHQIGYRGQRYRIHILDDAADIRQTIYWSDQEASREVLRGLNKRHGWSDARCDAVVNKETGE